MRPVLSDERGPWLTRNSLYFGRSHLVSAVCPCSGTPGLPHTVRVVWGRRTGLCRRGFSLPTTQQAWGRGRLAMRPPLPVTSSGMKRSMNDPHPSSTNQLIINPTVASDDLHPHSDSPYYTVYYHSPCLCHVSWSNKRVRKYDQPMSHPRLVVACKASRLFQLEVQADCCSHT